MAKDKGKLSQISDRVSIVVAVMGIILAVWANIKATEANAIAREANQIARESVNIQYLDSNPDIRLISKQDLLWMNVFGCRADQSLLQVKAIASLGVVFSNSGGRTASLVSVEVSGPDYWWTIRIYDKDGRQVNLPLDISPGTSRRWSFEISAFLGSGHSANEMDQMEYYKKVIGKPLVWLFHFGNGDTVNLSTVPSLGGIPSWNFDIDCFTP